MRLRRLLLYAAPPATVAVGMAFGPSLGPKQAAPSNASPPMPQPIDCSVHEEGVEARFNYQDVSVKALSTRRDGSSSDGHLIGANWNPQRVLVRDGRREKKPRTLDANGFAMLADAKPQHSEYYDERAVVGDYYAACEELVKRVSGASLVVAFDHNVRCDTGKAWGRRLRGGNRVQGAAALVHNDYTADSASRRLAMLTQPPTLLKESLRAKYGTTPLLRGPAVDDAIAGKRRYAFVNVWRPISTVESKPIGCIDATTVSSDELVTLTVHHADEGTDGGIYFASHRPAHKWFYYPAMTPDEVLLIKQWDSHGGMARGDAADKGHATFTLHSAFADPTTMPTAKDRESIEVRLVLIY